MTGMVCLGLLVRVYRRELSLKSRHGQQDMVGRFTENISSGTRNSVSNHSIDKSMVRLKTGWQRWLGMGGTAGKIHLK